jgi:site-specific DNA recombinase
MRFAEADEVIDLGTDSRWLAARILVAVAKAEQERKSERQKLANEAAAIAGERRLGSPRPFGYCDDHATPHPQEGPAVTAACRVLLGGGTLSGVMREWAVAGLTPAQLATGRWSRQSIRTILLNPRVAGLSAYRGQIVGTGNWQPLVSEETWRAVRAILEDPARKPPRGVRTLLGGLACCPCGNVVTGCRRTPGITSTGAPRPAATPRSQAGTWRAGQRQSRASSSGRCSPGCPGPTRPACSPRQPAGRT